MFDWSVWAGFVLLLLTLLFVDLGLFHREAHEVPFRAALIWVGVWVGLAALFGAGLLVWKGGRTAGEFTAAYVIEWSLSVDNVFVFLLVIRAFAVPPALQHRVLFLGVLGAVTMRLGFILGGAALLNRFEWVAYVFGAILLATAVRFLVERQDPSLADGRIMRGVRRFLPFTDRYVGHALFVREGGGRVATPLLAALVVITFTDVVFAVDSVPAVFSVTRDAFIAFSSNALAILGLRALYFVLAGAVGRFHYLKPSLAAVLAFVGLKMVVSSVVEIPIMVSLAVVVAILSIGIVASAAHSRRGVYSGGSGPSGG